MLQLFSLNNSVGVSVCPFDLSYFYGFMERGNHVVLGEVVDLDFVSSNFDFCTFLLAFDKKIVGT